MLATTQLECVRGERRLFSNLSFDAAPHTLLEVRGPNGSGKTSLLRNLCGLLPVAEGTVSWKGSDIRELGDEYRAQLLYLGHLPGIKDELTALQNLRFHAATSGLPATETGHISACGDTLPRLLNGRVKCFRGQLDREFGDAGFGTLGSDFHDDSCFHFQAETRRRE